MVLQRLDAVFVLAGMLLATVAYLLANARWRYTALPPWKASLVFIGFMLGGFVAGAAGFAALVGWALNHCAVPDCP
ncbi:MAG TPA: hypothetical protein VGD01_18530 [Candidatus Elarobacter sp.]|jgi:hypothetical protein